MRGLIVILALIPTLLGAQEADKSLYLLSPRHIETSIRHEIGVSIGTHWSKSQMWTTFTTVEDGVAYPEPVFSRVIGVGALTYEPRLRLLEYKSVASLSLDIPLTASFSVVDVLSGSRRKYSAEPLTEQEINSNIFSKERSGFLGLFHGEAGALLSLNFGQGATLENTQAIGWTVSAGYNYLRGPLFMNFFQDNKRSDYGQFMGWATPVGRLGMHIDRFVLYYMIGLNPTRVIYQTGSTFEPQIEMTRTYNRLSISVRLGR